MSIKDDFKNAALIATIFATSTLTKAQGTLTTYSFSEQFTQSVSGTLYGGNTVNGSANAPLGLTENFTLQLNTPANWSGFISTQPGTNVSLFNSLDMSTTVGNKTVYDITSPSYPEMLSTTADRYNLTIENGVLVSWFLSLAQAAPYQNQPAVISIYSSYNSSIGSFVPGNASVYASGYDNNADYIYNTGSGAEPIVGVTSIVPESSTNVLLELGAVVLGTSILSRKRATPSPNGPAG